MIQSNEKKKNTKYTNDFDQDFASFQKQTPVIETQPAVEIQTQTFDGERTD